MTSFDRPNYIYILEYQVNEQYFYHTNNNILVVVIKKMHLSSRVHNSQCVLLVVLSLRVIDKCLYNTSIRVLVGFFIEN
jgi:hypothetical protein